jgi:hypothetical protein
VNAKTAYSSHAAREKELLAKSRAAYFIEQYTRLAPRSSREYDGRRDRGSPAWASVARGLGLKNWRELLDYCGLERPVPVRATGRRAGATAFTVHIHTDLYD